MDQDASINSSDSITPLGNCPLVKIPLEILLSITKDLTTPELGNLRLTCRSIERSLDHAFVNGFFTRKKFMFTKFSLKTLRNISQSRLAPYLRQLDFGLEHFLPVEDSHRSSSDPSYSEAVAKYQEFEFKNNQWVFSGRRQQTLMAALSRLENLKTIMIRENSSQTRFRDGKYFEWNSYGLVTLSKETGLSLSEISSVSRLGLETTQEIFICIMQALAQAQITTVKDIEFVGHNYIRLRDQSFAIPSSIRAGMVPILKNLEKLHIHPDWNGHETGDSHLMKFLSQTVNLRDLRINGLSKQWQNASAPIFRKWLKHSDRSEVLPKLQALSLGSAWLEEQELTDLITRFSETLVSLELWRINLTNVLTPELRATIEENPDASMASLQESFDNQEHLGLYGWKAFFSQCHEGLSNLRRVKFGYLSQTLLEPDGKRPVDPSEDITFDDEIRVIEYTGPDWKSFVGEKVLKIGK